MKLQELIPAAAITSELSGSTRDAVLGELLDILISCKAAPASSREAMLKALVKREKAGSTGFGHGVAVPHVRLPGMFRPVAAIGLSRTGVNFLALDRQPVYSVVMIVSPDGDATAHLDAMETVFSCLSSDRFRSFLRQATTVAEVLTLLQEADEGAPVR
ncbi:MAG: PTS sugar transporter subunit IIA [Phycisphaerales bacterium]|nr:PTS sugar transporter subunit IIA [Phycisphaerales bacterium]